MNNYTCSRFKALYIYYHYYYYYQYNLYTYDFFCFLIGKMPLRIPHTASVSVATLAKAAGGYVGLLVMYIYLGFITQVLKDI
jgi:hypothetical protein